MKRFSHHIRQIQGKPHHVRKRIAFGAATFGAALIALVWFVGSLGAGTFAIQGASFAESTGQGTASTADAGNGTENLAGAAAAVSSASAPAHIEIIDAASSTGKTKKAEQTTIPF